MKKSVAYPLIVLLVAGISYLMTSTQKEDSVTPESESVKTEKTPQSDFDFLPTSTTNQIVKHPYYTLSYSEPHEQAEWVAYELKKEHLSRTNRKRPLFQLDKKVKTKSAHWGAYKKSGYTKGHLLPAGDRKFSHKAYTNTFLMSNVSPQEYNFNAGIWNRLEQKVRYWAGKERHLYVITGGVLEDNLKTIGRDKVAVPKYFYKVLLDNSEPEIKAIAFLVPHKDSNKPLYDFVVSIDKIEALTGIDFFPALPDDLENKLEESTNYKKWSF